MKLNQIENVLSDKGSKYSVSGATVRNRADVAAVLKKLRSKKKYAKATHNTWAVVFADGEPVKDDDGESGAGVIMLAMLDRAGVTNQVVIVTRWYGGVHLGADRFRHVRTCVTSYLQQFGGSTSTDF
ncbi:YigZ family protein [Arenicella xantha]|uniref:Uncharacterized protein UPF0029 n=1 Tax=Arenicella xantha TaxID=644221 RepID=A0A395JN33_9GAMM|nr:YigZ family protein [Arenicella xantha]RBP49304.1 uncharacterized protein UPF0029 [Arenicella xantha]